MRGDISRTDYFKTNYIVHPQTFGRTVFRPQCSVGSLAAREPFYGVGGKGLRDLQDERRDAEGSVRHWRNRLLVEEEWF